MLLDVDGVVNAFPHTPTDSWDDFRQTDCAGFTITHSLDMGKRIKALDADIVTTWEQDDMANEWIAPLFGWDDLPILHAGDEWYRRGWWKSTVLQKFIMENPRPFVWLDDDLDYSDQRGEIDWVRECGLPFLLISPKTEMGLEPRHFELIEAFLANPVKEMVP